MQRVIVVASTFLLLSAGLLGCSQDKSEKSGSTPDDLKVTGTVIARVQAKGEQLYSWYPLSNSWKLKSPDATFEGDHIKGKHYSGPTWEADDGSSVTGKKIVEHPSPNAKAIPWLLLEAIGHEGTGVFSGVTYIQRLNTTGGKPPAKPGHSAGEEIRVSYTAEYVFYGPKATTVPLAN